MQQFYPCEDILHKTIYTHFHTFMQCNLIISLRNEVEQNIFQNGLK